MKGTWRSWCIVCCAIAELTVAPRARAHEEAAPASASPAPPLLTAAQPPFDPAELVRGADPRQSEARLEIYGFADFTVSAMLADKSNRWRGYVNPNTTMGVGNLNVYLKSTLSERARSLIELRFSYLPNGHSEIQPDGSIRYTDTTVRDSLERNRMVRWGSVVIERAWVEYEFHNLLTVRAGQYLTPYGIWNVDHGSPTIIGIRRPFVITDSIFPERQTGLELHGRHSFSNNILGYHLTVSNGRGIADEYVDHDDHKALGGRMFLSSHFAGAWRFGMSFYSAKRTEKRDRWTIKEGVRSLESDEIARSREFALAADARWLWKGLHVQAEFLTRRRTYDDEARERLAAYPYAAFDPNNRRWGTYALVGYRMRSAVMPYVLFERTTFPTGGIPAAEAVHAGINYRPEPALVLKAEILHAWFPGALPTSFGVDALTLYALQVAWVF